MGKIVAFFIDRPMLINVTIIAIIIVGINSIQQSRKEGFPEISMNKVIIETIYPGSSSSDVEINVTVPIEDALAEVEGIQEILSVSREGVSRIEVQANENASAREFDKMYDDINNALNKIDDLPRTLDSRPTLSEFTSADVPIMEIAYTGEYSKLKPYLERLKSQLLKIPGVASIDLIGLPDEEVQILVDPVKAKQNYIDLRRIAASIEKRNLEGSGGTIESFIGEKKVVFLNKFHSYEDVLNTNIIMSEEGYGVKVKDVAHLKLTPEDMRLIVRNNGRHGATLSLKKTGSSDLLETVDLVKDLLEKQKLPDGAQAKILLDQSQLTRDRISLLVGNALIGFVLVIVILLLVFDFKTALWTAFGIPFTLIGMFIYLKTNDISINLISLGGFIIIIGMLVDDAIVIAEEINSNKEKGMEAKEAAITAVQRIWMPVTASALTTMLAFSPLFALGGFPGKFIWAIPLMVIVGLIISLLESFLILPSHLHHGKQTKQQKKSFIIWLENIYQNFLTFALRYRYAFLTAMIALLIISLVAMKMFVKKDPFPQDAAEGFNITITLPKGSSAQKATDYILPFENLLLALPPEELVGFSVRIGTHSMMSATNRGTQNSLVAIFVYLSSFSERDRTAQQIMDKLDKQIAAIVNKNEIEYSLSLQRLGPPMGKPFEIRVISNDDEKREKIERQIRDTLSTVDGVYDVENDQIVGKNELNLVINHDTLSMAQLSVDDILTTLRIAFDGLVVTDMITIDKKINFRLKLDTHDIEDFAFVKNLPIMNNRGNLIKLDRFADIQEQPSRAEIRHVDGQRATTVFGNTNLEIISPVEVMTLVRDKFVSNNQITDQVTIDFSGQPVESEKIFAGLGSAAIIAFFGIYLLISLMFNSFAKAIIIMVSLPFLTIGLAFVLLTHGIPASMMAGVAMVGLMGVAVNGSIVMVHTIHGLADAHGGVLDINTITLGAVSRLRPVLLTTITTTMGVLPTGYGIGGFDPFLSHMSLALAYGLLFGSLIILLLVPLFFTIGVDMKNVLNKIRPSKQQNAHG